MPIQFGVPVPIYVLQVTNAAVERGTCTEDSGSLLQPLLDEIGWRSVRSPGQCHGLLDLATQLTIAVVA